MDDGLLGLILSDIRNDEERFERKRWYDLCVSFVLIQFFKSNYIKKLNN